MAHFTKRIFPFFKIGLIFNVKQKKLNIFTICLTNFCEDTTFVLSAIDKFITFTNNAISCAR